MGTSKKENRYKSAIVWGLILILIYLFVVKPAIIDKIKLNNNFERTKAKIISSEGAIGGVEYNVEYFVNGKRYSSSFLEDSRYKTNVGDCLWIRYYPPNPKICELIIGDTAQCD